MIPTDSDEWTAREFSISISNQTWKQIDSFCYLSHEHETGGVLIGNYSDDRLVAFVLEASGPPNDSKSGRTWFHRGTSGLKKLFALRWNKTQRSYYIGEWHYHPVSVVEPSSVDLHQMEKISKTPSYQCSTPIMLIVGKNLGQTRPARVFVFPLGKVPVELIRTQADFIGAYGSSRA